MRSRTRPAAIIPSEHEEQCTVVEWLEIHKILYFAVPNGGQRTTKTNKAGVRFCREGQKLKSEGVKPGVPDLIIIDPPPRRPGAPGTVIEMKRRAGGTVSRPQKAWAIAFKQRGWAHHFAKGAKEAIDFLTELGYGTRR